MQKNSLSRHWHFFLQNALFEPISSTPLSLFRIGFALTLLLEVSQIIRMQDLLFVERPLVESLSLGHQIGLGAWIISLLLLLIGLATPIASLLNYGFVTYFFHAEAPYQYHADYIYREIAFITLFMPLAYKLSLDRVILKKWKGVDTANILVPRMFNNFLALYAIGFMYFDSGVYKLESDFWRNGLGVWLPASFPSFTVFSWNFLLNQKWLMVFASHLTLLLEISFVFLFWHPGWRRYFLLVGVLLHVGIATVLPIPLFGTIMVLLYVSFFPYSKSQQQESDTQRSGFSHFGKSDVWRMRALTVIIPVLLFLQILIAFNVQLPTIVRKPMEYVQYFTGLASHHVFGHNQFEMMTRDVALVFQDAHKGDIWLPYITDEGHVSMADGGGRLWSSWWLFSVPTYLPAPQRWTRAAEVWLKQNDIDPDGAVVVVKSRTLKMSREWERDRELLHQRSSWIDIATIQWTDRVAQLTPIVAP